MFKREQQAEKSNIEMLKLKNGSEVAKPIVFTTMITLNELMETNPIAFFELVQKCRNPQHEMFGNTEDEVRKWGLMDYAPGKVHECTRDIVLSAVEGDDLGMQLTSPVAPQSTISNRM